MDTKIIKYAPVMEVGRAKWTDIKLIDRHMMGECSNCLKMREVDNFCSNCGAMMEIEAADTED